MPGARPEVTAPGLHYSIYQYQDDQVNSGYAVRMPQESVPVYRKDLKLC